MKELKAPLLALSPHLQHQLWNPVKELKVNLAQVVADIVVDKWNPVKELKVASITDDITYPS